MPEAIGVETGEEVGFGTVPVEKSPYTGGPVRPLRLSVRGVAGLHFSWRGSLVWAGQGFSKQQNNLILLRFLVDTRAW